MRASHASETDATEMGAYAIATAALGKIEGWRVMGRAQNASGADMLMLAEGERDEEAFVRLEVSGMAKGVGTTAQTSLKARLAMKLNQLRRGDEDEPGVAAVFGFELALLLIAAVRR